MDPALGVDTVRNGGVQFKRHWCRVSLHPSSFEVDGTHDEMDELYASETIAGNNRNVEEGLGDKERGYEGGDSRGKLTHFYRC